MSFASVWGFALVGIEAIPVRVEAHARSGLPGVTIVGLPGAAVREAHERVRSGAACSGFPLPMRRITINLSPGDVPKDGSGFDLPMALAMLAACGHVPAGVLGNIGAIGELSLDGLVRVARGVLPAAETAARMGLASLITPVGGLAAGSAVGSVRMLGVRSMDEAVAVLRRPEHAARIEERGRRLVSMRRTSQSEGGPFDPLDLADVAGHLHAKRALEVAAAGGHHLLLVGPPGTGKTMLARRLPGLLPPLSPEEALEVTRIRSATGLHTGEPHPAANRPFRAPHHTASRAALVGGGALLRPGEVTLAHRGVLFIDELPEFSRDALEALRQPLEEGRVTICRRSGTAIFPADCAFVGAMNPCPCGYFGHPEKECRCTASVLDRYRGRVSGPLLDRIDLLLEIPPLTADVWSDERGGVTSAEVRSRVVAGRNFRDHRLSGQPGRGGPPALVPRAGRGISENTLRPASDARRLLQKALVTCGLSGRAYLRTLGVARTIADLENIDEIRADHVAEALSMRLDRRSFGWG